MLNKNGRRAAKQQWIGVSERLSKKIGKGGKKRSKFTLLSDWQEGWGEVKGAMMIGRVALVTCS